MFFRRCRRHPPLLNWNKIIKIVLPNSLFKSNKSVYSVSIMVPTSIKSILCDIEGTTTSISFVKVGLPADRTIFSCATRLGVTTTGVSFLHWVQNANFFWKYCRPPRYYNKILKSPIVLSFSVYFRLKNAKQNVKCSTSMHAYKRETEHRSFFSAKQTALQFKMENLAFISFFF